MKPTRLLSLLALTIASTIHAQEGQPVGPGAVSDPVVPWETPEVRSLPPVIPLPEGYDVEAHRRQDWGIIVPDIDLPPHGNPLVDLQQWYNHKQVGVLRAPDGFDTPVAFAGATSPASPPDNNGDVGPSHYLQGVNGAGGGQVSIYNKSGTLLQSFLMETLGTSPCNSGLGDPVVKYDALADRWLITEFNSPNYNSLCVYVSKTADPQGAYWAYSFNPANSGSQDYPKYAVWPSGYFVGVNNGGWVFAMNRAAMLTGSAATMQEFNIGTLSGFGFQLTMPAAVEGPLPPANAPAYFLRPRDTEIHGGSCSGCDLMEIWSLSIDWATPANSQLTQMTSAQLTDWDHTLCGTGSIWNCMPQAGTTQKIDPIREPIHFPLQYRNFTTHETLVGAFAQDTDGTDHAGVHWFELRRTPPGSGNWTKYQDGVIGGEATVHRSVASAAMDQAGNIAVGYTRTGTNLRPSIYYAGRLASDPLGVMSHYDNVIIDATTSKTNNERWGDYCGIGLDPSDDCTFWYTTEYGGSGQTRIAHFKFDSCGGCTAPGAPNLSAPTVSCAGISLSWSPGSGTTSSYNVYRASGGCPAGSLTKVAGPITATTDLDASATPGSTYAYVVRGACDAGGNNESSNSTCRSVAATGPLAAPAAPTFAAVSCTTVTVNWSAVTGATGYDLYRTTGGSCAGAVKLNGSPIAATTYNDTGRSPGASYSYYVVARNASCLSANGSCGTVTMLATPAAPAAPTFTGVGCNAVTVNWSAVNGAASYDVWRASGNGTCAGAVKITGSPVAGTSYADSGLTPNQQYSYYVTANNACGTSASGACGAVTTTCLPNIVYLSSGNWTQITGDGDAYYDRGEKWSVEVTLTNVGNATATNVAARLSGTGASMCSNPGVYGTIPVAGSATYTYELVIAPAFSPCGAAIDFALDNKTSTELTPAGAPESAVFSVTVGKGAAGAPTDLAIQPSSADSYVSSTNANTNYGTQTGMDVDRGSSNRRRALVQFDLSAIPTGSTINSATLELYAYAAPGSARTLNVHRVTSAWTENGVTWNGTPTFTASADDSIAAGSSTGWKIWSVTAVAQGWVDGSSTNRGFLVKDNSESGSSSRLYSFDTRDSATSSTRPILRINYTPPSSPDCSYVGTGSCLPPNPKEASPIATPMGAAKGSGSQVDVAFTPGCGATDHVIYAGSGPISGAPSWTVAYCGLGTLSPASFDPGTPAPGGLTYFVIVAQNPTREGSYGQSFDGSVYTERAEADNSGWSCNLAQDLSGSCP